MYEVVTFQNEELRSENFCHVIAEDELIAHHEGLIVDHVSGYREAGTFLDGSCIVWFLMILDETEDQNTFGGSYTPYAYFYPTVNFLPVIVLRNRKDLLQAIIYLEMTKGEISNLMED